MADTVVTSRPPDVCRSVAPCTAMALQSPRSATVPGYGPRRPRRRDLRARRRGAGLGRSAPPRRRPRRQLAQCV